jgi:hypothetical protein
MLYAYYGRTMSKDMARMFYDEMVLTTVGAIAGGGVEAAGTMSFGRMFLADTLAGSGPSAGFLEVSARVRSTAAVRNFASPIETDFIYNFKNNQFLMGDHALGHDGLRRIMGASERDIVGGNIFRNESGLFTNEMSGKRRFRCLVATRATRW